VKAARLAVWLLVLALGGSAQAQMSAYGMAAKVNGVGISNEKLERSFEEYMRESGQNIAAIRYPDRVKVLRGEALDLLIEQELVWQAAQKKGIVATPEEVTKAVDKMRAGFPSSDEFVSRLAIEGYTEESYREHMKHLVSAQKYLESLTRGVEVSDAEVHEFYAENVDKFRMPEGVRARHILLKLAPDADEAARQAAREKMAGILAEARSEGGDFAALAKQHSEDGTAAGGGDLGYFPRGRMPKPFEDATFGLEPGQVSDVVETRFGLHIILLEDYREASQAPEEEVGDRVREYLVTLKRKQIAEQTIKDLRSNADIEILMPL
jgi:peptidyl-prolyl cis-trans isomerase C